MSFLSFWGGFALWNVLCDRLSCKSKPSNGNDSPTNLYLGRRGYDIDDLDAIEDRIDDLQSELDRCDFNSCRYDDIQDEIDSLEEQLDDILYDDEIYDDLDYFDD